MLALDSFVTDCNSVVFDVDHDFAGCIPGCHEILRRQGLLTSIECLDPAREAQPGPERRHRPVYYATYPELHDDASCRQPRALAGLTPPLTRPRRAVLQPD